MDTDNYYDVIPGSNPTSPVEKNAPVQQIYVRVSMPHIDMQVGHTVSLTFVFIFSLCMLNLRRV